MTEVISSAQLFNEGNAEAAHRTGGTVLSLLSEARGRSLTEGETQHKMCRKMNFAPGYSRAQRYAALLGSEAAQGKRSARQWAVRLQDAQQCHNCAIVPVVPWLSVSPSFCVEKDVKNEKRRKEK